MNIIKSLTNINYTKGNNRKIEYIVMHYVGAVSSAKNNADYFKNTYRGASAHYFVDDNDIYQVVEDKDISWHCGSNKYYCNARNTNSIGIEMCCYKNDGKLDISSKTEEKAIDLVKELMKKYNIDVNHVIRHYDVSHKICPAPFVNDIARWNNFKAKLGQTISEQQTTTSTPKNVLEWQKIMNKCYGCGLAEDNSYGPDSKAKANKYYLHYKIPTIKNDHVKFIQEQLCRHGYIVDIDRSFGPDCENKTKQFQKDHGLTVDGCVGAKTTELLLK